MAYENWIDPLGSLLGRSVEGVQAVHSIDNLPASLIALPAWVILPVQGSVDVGGANVMIHTVQAILYAPPGDLAAGYQYLTRAIDLVLRAIAENLTLGGAVAYCKPPSIPSVFYQGPGQLTYNYGDKNFLGISFTLEVKELLTMTVGA